MDRIERIDRGAHTPLSKLRNHHILPSTVQSRPRAAACELPAVLPQALELGSATSDLTILRILQRRQMRECTTTT